MLLFGRLWLFRERLLYPVIGVEWQRYCIALVVFDEDKKEEESGNDEEY